jgi:hypothetical protein
MRCVILVLRSIDTSAGIAGKDFRENDSEVSGQRLRLPSPPQNFCNWLRPAKLGPIPQEEALVALAGRCVKWTRLAVQQQLIEPDSHADYSFTGAESTAASIRARPTTI